MRRTNQILVGLSLFSSMFFLWLKLVRSRRKRAVEVKGLLSLLDYLISTLDFGSELEKPQKAKIRIVPVFKKFQV